MFNKFLTDTTEAGYLSSTELDASAAVVLLKMMYRINRFNIVHGKPDVLIQAMGISQWDFHHGVRSLKNLDLIRKYTKWEYMINPNVMFNGDDKQQYIVQHMWDTQTKKGLRKC